MHSRHWAIAAVTTTAMFLVGCGGAPSEGDIKLALEQQMNRERQAMGALGGAFGASMSKMAQDLMPMVKGVHKIGCKDDGENAYRCDVEMALEQGGKLDKTTTQLRLLKGSEGWVISR